jgi:virulence factor Mce-like protein
VRRLAALALLLLAAAGCGGGGTPKYCVDVIFDDARGLVPGQLIKVAGAEVGTIEEITLTKEHRARVHTTVERRFAPFRRNARCTIRPEGLIAENYVDCDPGTPDAPELEGKGGRPPTVPVDHTTQPVNITDFFEVASVPVRDRIGVLVSELGMGMAGRGRDINAILRRANPALAQARTAIGILRAHRRDLAATVEQTDALVARLARRPQAIPRFVDRAATVTTRIAEHRGALEETVRRLPPLLDEARPALADLDAFAAGATPLLRELRAAAPGLDRLTADVRPFVRLARPALRRLDRTIVHGTGTARRARPLLAEVRRYTLGSEANARLMSRLLLNLRDRGFIEHLMGVLHHAATAMARFDKTSHLLPARIGFSGCGTLATRPNAACSAANRRRAARPAVRDEELAPLVEYFLR